MPSERVEEIPEASEGIQSTVIIRKNLLHLGSRGLTAGLPGSRASLSWKSHGVEGIKDLSRSVLLITHTWRLGRALRE